MPSETSNKHLSIIQSDFGTLSSGENAQLYTLSNADGLRIKISNYGAIIVALVTLDKSQVSADIVLGYDNVKAYEEDPYYLGAVIGRYAGRIDKGELVVEDKTYQLSINNNDNQLHGGVNALNKQLWQATTECTDSEASLTLRHTSPDGDNGFPGNVTFAVKYSLNKTNEISVEYFASTDKTTVVNLTQHSYFNLAGHNAGNVSNHLVQLNADHFLTMDERIYPTGEIRNVANTAHDFSNLTALSENIDSNDEQVKIAKGFDNYWLTTNDAISGNSFTAQAVDPESGRRLTLYSDQPCLILYTANYIDGSQVGKNNYCYQKHDAFCFEPLRLANMNSSADIKNTILRPDQPFYSKSRYIFDSTCMDA